RRHARVRRHAKDPVLIAEVTWAPVQLIGRNPPGLVQDGARRLVHRRAADGHAARVEGASPERDRLRVALHDGNVVERQAKDTSRPLGETGGMALAGALRAAEYGRVPVGVDHHARAFVAGTPEPDRTHRHGRSGAGALRKRGEADTEIPALAA